MALPFSTQRQFIIYVVIGLHLIATACSKKDQAPAGTAAQQEVNTWILENIRHYYLYDDVLNHKTVNNTEPASFFAGLLQKDDRYSAIYNTKDFGTIPRGMLRTVGMDFYVVTWPTAPGGAIGIVNFVIPGTKAALGGLQRGDYFTKINGALLTPGNAATLSQTLLEQPSGSVTKATMSGNMQPVETGLITLDNRTIVENPIYEKIIWHVHSKQVGYLFLNSFDDYYNKDLLARFIEFKQAGVTEMILDLRYNPGGSITAATVLSALIAPGVNENNPFIQFTGNKKLGNKMNTFKEILDAPAEGNAIVHFNELAKGCLQLPRVFILSTGITASAAEVTINNLKPYTQVIHIGETTYGKDVGAVTITDETHPQRIDWALLPVTYKLANAAGNGGYSRGITPQYIVDEKKTLPLLPIGSKEDPLIAGALSLIANRSFTQSVRQTPPGIKFLYSSQKEDLRKKPFVILAPVRRGAIFLK